jgi:hypothetical protein
VLKIAKAIWLDPKYHKDQGCTISPKNLLRKLNKKNSLCSNSFLFLTPAYQIFLTSI